MARVIPVDDVRYTPAVAVLEGHADAPVSVYVTELAGRGPHCTSTVGASDEPVRVVSVHRSPEVVQTNL